MLPQRVFRSGLQDLLLDARAAVDPSLYRPLLEWMTEQTAAQLHELTEIPIGYDELCGIYARAPVVSLEHELMWISERLRLESARLNLMRAATGLIQDAVFATNYEEAISGLTALQQVLGVSLWSVQLRIALEHLAGGLERQKRYSAEVRNAHRSGLLGFTAYHSSVRNEDRTTLAKYLDDIEVRVTGLSTHSDATKTYDRFQLKNELPATDAGLAEVLRIEQSQGIVDVYETFVAVLQEIARRDPGPDRASLVVRCIDQLDIQDFRLTKIAKLLDPGRATALPARSTSISEALFAGRVRTAMRRASQVVSNDPWQHIYAGFALSHGGRQRDPVPARPNNVASLIARILSRCDGSDDAWSQLTKLCVNLKGLPLAAGLLEGLVQLRRTRPDQPWKPWLVGLHSPFEGAEDRPWTLGCAIGPDQNDATGLAWYEASCPSSNQAQPFPLIRAVGHVARGDFDAAGELGDDDGLPEALRSIGALVRLHALFARGERQRIVTLIASEGARSATHEAFLPIVGALGGLTWQDYKQVDHPLASPIALHLLWSRQEVSEVASMLRFATGHALRRAGARPPSDLDPATLGVEPHEFLYFLRKVCVPEVLDLSRMFNGTRAILEERQAICGALMKLDPVNSEEYQQEIILIANELAHDEGQWIVATTRIHVDSDGLIRWAVRELAEDYERYRDLVGVEIEAPQSFEDVMRELEAGPAQRSNFVPDNEADAVLVSILRRLGEEFLTNPSSGLDFFLSKRVRHQSFIGLIRGPLEFSDLITTRESERGEYHPNVVWLDRFTSLDETARGEIDGALRRFAAKFDEMLTHAKDAYFHLRGPDNPQGMIVLALNDRLIGIVRTMLRLDLTFSEFLRTAIPILWAGIEPSLASIRALINDEIKSNVTSEFDILRARVREIAEQDPVWLDFDAALGQAANEVQIKLDEAAQWFVHADTLRQHRLFSLGQILSIGVDTALKSHRDYDPEVTQSSQGDLHLHAANLVFIHDVLFVGLGNAKKHSGLKKPRLEVAARWNEAERTVTVSVESDCRASNRVEKEKEAAKSREMIADGKYDRRTRVEEFSGFAKLAAVVLQSDRGRIDFGFTPEGRFRLEVTYAILQPNREVADAG